jgi:hypothetical protein
MNVAFRPALPGISTTCERLYFAEMERINRELNLDRNVQVASFRHLWEFMQVRIITLDANMRYRQC